MKIFNFSHPLTQAQMEQLHEYVPDENLEEVLIKCHVDFDQDLWSQTNDLLDQVDVQADEVFIINPPALAAVCASMMVEICTKYSRKPHIRFYVISMRAITRGIAREFEIWDVSAF